MVTRSKSRSYPSKGPRRETIWLPGTIWRYSGWLVPGLFVLALLSFGWWRLSKERILSLPALTEPAADSAVPAKASDTPSRGSSVEMVVGDLVAEESARGDPAEFDILTNDGRKGAPVLDLSADHEIGTPAWSNHLTVTLSSPPDEPLHVVRSGESLYAIARQHGVGVDSLLDLNLLRDPDLLWVGQRVRLPLTETGPALPDAIIVHTVAQSESLLAIAVRYKASPWAIAVASGLRNPSLIYPGQRLLIPVQDSAPAAAPSPPHPAPAAEDKWIDVDLTAQRVVAYEGAQPVFSALVSTGLPGTPTVTGRYYIYLKYRTQTMYGGNRASGDYYYLPDVPYVQYFYQGYSFHGTYWHDNFGQPMSRGCVNMRTDDARWLFEWAEPDAPPDQNQTWADDEHPGTLVVIH